MDKGVPMKSFGSMSDVQKEVLTKHHGTLVNDVAGKYVLPILVSEGVITRGLEADITAEGKAGARQINEALLRELPKRGSGAFAAFIKGLRDGAGQHHLADALETAEMEAMEAQKQIELIPAGSPSTVNIVLLGKDGNGKSETGNTLLGKKAFETSSRGFPQTSGCQKVEKTERHGKIVVVDTPGIIGMGDKGSNLPRKIAECLALVPEGVHAFPLVFRAGNRFTPEEENAVKALEALFGPNLFEYGFLLFTHSENLERQLRDHNETVEDFLYDERNPQWFKDLANKVQGRCIFFENKARETDSVRNQEQLKQFGQIMNKIMHDMAGEMRRPYSNKYIKQVDEAIEMEAVKRARASVALAKEKEEMCEIIQNINSITSCDVAEGHPDKAKESSSGGDRVAVEIDKMNLDRSWHEAKRIAKKYADDLKRMFEKGLLDSQERAKASELTESIKQLMFTRNPEFLPDGLVEDARELVRRSKEDGTGMEEVIQHLKNTIRQELMAQSTPEKFMTAVIRQIEEEIRKDMAKTGACFPDSANLLLADGKSVRMSLVEVGQKVLTGSTSASTLQEDTVYLFSHKKKGATSASLSISTKSGKTLTLSAGHFLFIVTENGKTALRPAGATLIGDTLLTVMPGEDRLCRDPVVKVTWTWTYGLYCPHTTSGSMVVDGVLVSCYTDFMNPRLAHALLYPISLLARTTSYAAKGFNRYDEEDGMPVWLLWLRDGPLAWINTMHLERLKKRVVWTV